MRRNRAADPTPPLRMPVGPITAPTTAPVPAPTLPSATGPREAAVQAAYPMAASGRARGSPTARSKRIAAGTMGTRATPVSKP